MFSHFLKNKNHKTTNKKKRKKKKTHKIKMKEKVHKKQSPFCVVWLRLGMEPALEHGWLSTDTPLGKTDFPFPGFSCK